MGFDPRRDIPTLAILSPPVEDYPYFQGRSQAFDPDARGYSAVNAWWLAEASFLAYGDREFIETHAQVSPLLRDQVTLEFNQEDDGTFCFWIVGQRYAIAVFRGTRVLGLRDPLAFQQSLPNTWKDVVTDITFPSVPFAVHRDSDIEGDNEGHNKPDAGGIRVHSGFAEAFESISEELDAKLKQHVAAGRSIWFTGHSLGGALATLAAARFGVAKLGALYTYGCPRVGNAPFAELFHHARDYRLVHNEDIVPRLPPPLLPGIPPHRYEHAGQLVFIAADGKVTPEADAKALTDIFMGQVNWVSLMDGALKGLRDARDIVLQGAPGSVAETRVPRGPIPDHAPIYYASYLKEQLPARE